MVFSSLVFLFLFLPATIAFYYLAPKKLRNLVLLASSLFFYAWGETIYVPVMLGSIFLNYVFGRFVGSAAKRKNLYLAAGIAVNLLLLGFFKYFNFLVNAFSPSLSNLGITLPQIPQIHLPIGISFFTFQAMSYLIDVYRGETSAQKNLTKLALYIALFPQLIAGPIVRYHDVARQLEQRSHNKDIFVVGIQRFVIGLAKKVLIANTLASAADEVFSLPTSELTTAVAWLGLAAYSLQIYFDFSGYSDMAIGLGKMFGFQFLENFNYPYISRSVQEFWRRWHISLSNWFRDYLYIPLGGNRKGKSRTYFNLVIVFILCGFWHGAAWTFLIWGLLHGFFLILERSPAGKYLSQLPDTIRLIYTLLMVNVAWVFFRADDATHALAYLERLFSFSGGNTPLPEFLTPEIAIALIIGVLGATPLPRIWTSTLILDRNNYGKQTIQANLAGFAQFAGLITLLLLSIIYVSAGSYNPFIYFRF